MMYHGLFTDRLNVCESFGISDFDGVVIHASYDIDGYEGSADVIFANEGKFYTVSGSHCSCYGLEQQWIPEEMPLDTLKKIARGGTGRYSSAIRSAIDVLDNLGALDQDNDTIEVIIRLAFD